MSGHTPGPWTVGRTGHIIGQRVSPVAFACFGGEFLSAGQEAEANALLMAAAPDLKAALGEGRRAIGDHWAPNDCYATGPVTGDPIRDLVQCPACSFIQLYDAVIAKVEGRS